MAIIALPLNYALNKPLSRSFSTSTAHTPFWCFNGALSDREQSANTLPLSNSYLKQLCLLTPSHWLRWAFSLSRALMLCSHFQWSERQLMLQPSSLLCWRGPTHDQRVGWESSCGIVSQHSLPTYSTTPGWMNPPQTIVTHGISKAFFVCFHRLIRQTS